VTSLGDWQVHAAGPDDVTEISELSLRTFGDEDGASVRTVAHQVATWRDSRSAAIVARDRTGVFAGYAMAHPNRAGDVWRPDGQVAVLTHVAVVPELRTAGAGSALLERSVKTLRMLGWDRVLAQIPEQLVAWYRKRGWAVAERGETIAWVEPWIPSDSTWAPDLAPRAFSPLLSMIPREDYPYLAALEIGANRPLLEVVVPASSRRDDLDYRLGLAAAQAIAREPTLARVLPRALVEELAATPNIPANVRRVIQDKIGM
jgi:GNAT superfamily N-acetyltransferase